MITIIKARPQQNEKKAESKKARDESKMAEAELLAFFNISNGISNDVAATMITAMKEGRAKGRLVGQTMLRR
jgi:hypothetical protein